LTTYQQDGCFHTSDKPNLILPWPVTRRVKLFIDQKKTNWNCSWRRMGRLFSYQSSIATAGPKFTL